MHHFVCWPRAVRSRVVLTATFAKALRDGLSLFVRIHSAEERRLHTTCLETAKKAMESFGLFE